ncbi:MAG: type II secretion system F family protein [Candidatus Aenigmarchaeota archaeon]|nr:type II secretion system F family protein [Candidatus Aenigmarchaeota archaeon]
MKKVKEKKSDTISLEEKVMVLIGAYSNKELYSACSVFIFGLLILMLNQVVLSVFLSQFFTLILTVVSVLLMVMPIILLQYRHFQKMKNVEENFPNFVKAISEGLTSNMSLPQSVDYASRSNFGALTPYIDRMMSQISWGISFEDAFRNMARSINNRLITRAVSTIIEAHTYGGKIAKALDSIGKSVTEIEKLRRERISMISGQMMQGYVIFFVFVGVMIGLVAFLLPVLGSDAMGVGTGNVDLAAQYAVKFKHLSILQGFFSGIAIGKLSEGSIAAGFKHALIMSLIGYVALTLATL